MTTDRSTTAWWRVLAAAASRSFLLLVAVLLACSVLPALLGWWSTVVLTGSMAPALRPGDVVVGRSLPADHLAAGQVLLVDDPDVSGQLRLHRLVHVRRDGLVLRGDANAEQDSTPVTVDAVHGAGVLAVPGVGLPAVWWSERRTGPLALTLAGLLLSGWGAGLDRRPRTEGRRRLRPRRRVRPTTMAAPVGCVALLALVAGAPPDLSHAAFSATTSSPAALAAASSLRPYQDAVLADSPLLYWRLSDTTTAAADTSGNARPGTWYGTYTQGTASAMLDEPTDRAGTFSAGMITANASMTAPSAFTVEAWVKTTSTTGGRILGFGSGGGSSLLGISSRQLYLNPSGRVVFGTGITALTTVTSPAAYRDGQWHHVVGTFAPAGLTGTVRLYVDGQQVTSGTVSTPAGATGYWRAGAEDATGLVTPPGTYLQGSLDELAVYPTALTAARVLAHYTARSD